MLTLTITVRSLEPAGIEKLVRTNNNINDILKPLLCTSSSRCLSLNPALWETPRVVMSPLCHRSYRTHRTAWCRVPSIREGTPRLAGAPSLRARTRVLYRDAPRPPWHSVKKRIKRRKRPRWIIHSARMGALTLSETFRLAQWHFGRTHRWYRTFWTSTCILPWRRCRNCQ